MCASMPSVPKPGRFLCASMPSVPQAGRSLMYASMPSVIKPGRSHMCASMPSAPKPGRSHVCQHAFSSSSLEGLSPTPSVLQLFSDHTCRYLCSPAASSSPPGPRQSHEGCAEKVAGDWWPSYLGLWTHGLFLPLTPSRRKQTVCCPFR